MIADGKVYAWGYEGEGKDLQEVLLCLDERDGRKIWEARFNDFLSDTIYSRYSIGSPTVDGETGNVYIITTAGEVVALTHDGHELWRRTLGAEFGRITFPNGRTGSVTIDEDRVILHVITAHWGPVDGPAKDRFYCFDKHTGELVWSATPGLTPKDSSFSPPFVFDDGVRHLMYAGTGCGHVVCIDARTGDTQWRFPFATGGVNSAVLRRGDTVYAIHGKENLDSTVIGRMVALKDGGYVAPRAEPLVLGHDAERWRNDLVAFTSSPVLVGDRIYQTDATGELCAVDANNGAVLWHHKLAPDQIHASPVYADGKLYVPMNNGTFHIVRPTDAGPEVLQSVQLAGNCLGAPAVANGQLYVHTTDRLYCFGKQRKPVDAPAIARLQVVPYDILMRQGQTVPVRVRGLDADGRVVAERVTDVTWSSKGPAQPLFTADGAVAAAADARTGIAFLTVTGAGATGEARLRIVPSLPYLEDFDGIPLKPPPGGEGFPVADPPAAWIGAKLKFEVMELDGSKVLAKTL
ncbi:MAG: PQQ-binding-like beta-propeller repeat protein, partial [Saprospiraceae bacterium]|nr:PQQ-binding-like beta-propeller repeat protein [Saprospiraceae bacterium]